MAAQSPAPGQSAGAFSTGDDLLPETPVLGSRPDRRWFGLALIVIVYLGLAVAYARAIPVWQSPDEPAHYNYLAELGRRAEFPVLQPGDYDAAYLEAIKGRGFPADWSVTAIRYEGHQPPLYYLGGGLVHETLAEQPVPERVFWLRLYSIVLGGLALILAFLSARLIFPGWLALGPPLFIATIPQRLAITAAINNDVAAEFLMGGLLFALLGACLPERAWTLPGARLARWLAQPVPLGLLIGLLLLTKTTLYIGLLLVPLAYWLGADPLSGRRWQRVLRSTAIVWGIGLLVSGWWFLRNATVYGPSDPLAQAAHDAIVTGQPTTILTVAAIADFGATLFRSFWGQFGWMGVPLDDRSYRFLAVLTLMLAAGAILWFFRTWRRGAIDDWERRWLTLCGVAFLLLLVGVAGYNLKYVQPQGRYLFTALVPIGVFLTLGVRGWLPERWAPAGLLLAYPALLALDWWSLVHVIGNGFR